MTTQQAPITGANIKDIKGRRLVDANGYGGRKLYMIEGEYNDILLIAQKGRVIEAVSDLAQQDQRIHQGW